MKSRIWVAPLLLAVIWGIVPALPVLLRGEIIGHPFTDLYPSVWGLWATTTTPHIFTNETQLLGHPNGMGWYFSSPIRGLLARGLIPIFGVVATFNLLQLAARVAGVLLSWWAGRAWGLGAAGSLTVAAVFGCAPFFHGYAAEGIIEGVDGWTLAIWAILVGKRRHLLAIPALSLTILSSWYLGIAGCLLAVFAGLRDRRAWLSLLGIALVLPFMTSFFSAFPAGAPLSDEIRSAMGASLTIPTPGLTAGLQPFAQTTYIGWILILTLVVGLPRIALLATVPAVLSLGIGPIYDLPVFELIRFPYRWHAATLCLLGLAAGTVADQRNWWWLAPLITLESFLLSPIEPILPGSSSTVPAIYSQVDGPLVEIPGPVSKPPGEINRSRPRAQYLLYYQTHHKQPSPWVPDFNSVGVNSPSIDLSNFQKFDSLEGPVDRPELADDTIEQLTNQGVEWLCIQRKWLGSDAAMDLRTAVEEQGATMHDGDEERWLFRLP